MLTHKPDRNGVKGTIIFTNASASLKRFPRSKHGKGGALACRPPGSSRLPRRSAVGNVDVLRRRWECRRARRKPCKQNPLSPIEDGVVESQMLRTAPPAGGMMSRDRAGVAAWLIEGTEIRASGLHVGASRGTMSLCSPAIGGAVDNAGVMASPFHEDPGRVRVAIRLEPPRPLSRDLFASTPERRDQTAARRRQHGKFDRRAGRQGSERRRFIRCESKAGIREGR